ncbi:MAG: GNAT family N-acetyltransferase [Treponema sp.]|jgi:phosphinothricin acetyltransferase|nr:GNAT family N-acetyltransferase [Treponema sp.]
MIREVVLSDCKSIMDIYNYYIEKTIISFEESPLTVTEMETRVNEIDERFPYLVYEEEGHILGYAYVNTFQSRSAYRFTLENSIYVRNGYQGKGIGKALLNELINEVRKLEIHSIIAKIALPNAISIKLHETFYFKNAGILKEAGRKFDKWIDVGYWELIL